MAISNKNTFLIVGTTLIVAIITVMVMAGLTGGSLQANVVLQQQQQQQRVSAGPIVVCGRANTCIRNGVSAPALTSPAPSTQTINGIPSKTWFCLPNLQCSEPVSDAAGGVK